MTCFQFGKTGHMQWDCLERGNDHRESHVWDASWQWGGDRGHTRPNGEEYARPLSVPDDGCQDVAARVVHWMGNDRHGVRGPMHDDDERSLSRIVPTWSDAVQPMVRMADGRKCRKGECPSKQRNKVELSPEWRQHVAQTCVLPVGLM